MGKSIAIKLAILLVVASLVYSVFWFFKVGQVEKQINKFVSDNSSYISAGDVTVSGFPLTQKITIKNLKFSIPNSVLDKNEVMVPHLEANAGIMDSDYKIKLIDPVSIQDADGNISSVEFAQTPDITISISEGNITKFHYQDSGYKILSQDKSVSYSANSSMVSIKSNFELDKITHNISANINDIEGFSVINLYKNVLEKRVIDGIKTNEIALSSTNPATTNVDAAAQNPQSPSTVAANSAAVDPSVVAPSAAPTPVSNNAATTVVEVKTPANSNATNAAPAAAAPNNAAAPAVAVATANAPTPATNAPQTNTIPAATTDAQNPTAAANPQTQASETAAVNKGNLTLDLEYVLTPTQAAGQQANTPPDPTQIIEASSQYNKTIKISNLEFSNQLYKISVSGEMSSLPDDNLPSGGIGVKVEKVDALITQLSTELAQIAQKMKPVAAVVTIDPQVNPAAAPIEDPYQIFLTRISAGLNSVAKEIAAKNAVTKDQIAQFDLRREKNLDFLINETPIHEILGKF